MSAVDLAFLSHRAVIAFAVMTRSPSLLKYVPFFEPRVVQTMKDLSGGVFVDVGSYIGFYAFAMSSNFKKVIAVEPHPKTMRILKANAKMLGIDNIQFVQKAVHSDDGLLERLHLGKFGTWNTLLRDLPQPRYAGGNTKVRTITLSSLLKNYPAIDLVKVDVEGAEFEAVKGAIPIIDRVNSWIIEVELLERREEMEEILSGVGYTSVWITQRHIFARRFS